MMKNKTFPTTIYVDMDGVIADFFNEFAKVCEVNHWKEIPDKETSLKALAGTDFFGRLPKFDTADDLIDYVDVLTAGTWCILSSPLRGDHENSAVWKRVWLKDNNYKPAEAIFTSRKESYATTKDGTPNILIDDRVENINRWVEAGGIGICYQANESDYDDLLEEVYQTYIFANQIPATERKVVV